jgi:carbamoyl-phosphate synthase large subunit
LHLDLPVANHQTNILMTGAGAPGAAGIIHCLRQDPSVHIVAVDANPESVGRFLADDFETIPKAGDPYFIDKLLDLCRRKNIHVLLPLVTRELLPLAAYKGQFELAGVKLPVSTAASLEIANDKGKLYQFLEWRGIPVPAYRLVETIEQFETAVQELGYPVKPVCFKPTIANGSRGFRIMDTSVNEHHLLFNEKPSATYIFFTDAVRILSSQSFPELLVSEYLPGDEYSVDCLADEGALVIALPRLRKKMVNGISVAGVFIENKNIIAYCEKIIRELQLHGNIGIQVKQSAAGEFLVLEINPRVQGTISSALGAGINLPLLAVKQELGLPVSTADLTIKWGTQFIRHWTEVFYQDLP